MIRLGLIGYPLEHSYSKKLHERAFHALGLKGKYHLWEIPSPPEGKEELRSKVHAVRSGEVVGFNVTVPHKETILPYLDALTPTARSVGAVNTVYFDHQSQEVIGDNMDSPAFWVDVKRFLSSDDATYGKVALVLGAGGAARAVAYALLSHGWTVEVAARRISQAEALSQHFIGEFGRLSTHRLSNQKQLDVEPYHLIVNATSAGMYPETEISPWPDNWRFPPHVEVYDLVYNPPETLLLKQAGRCGLRTKNGLGMLVEQAALAFERWTGEQAPREEMLQAVR